MYLVKSVFCISTRSFFAVKMLPLFCYFLKVECPMEKCCPLGFLPLHIFVVNAFVVNS